MRIREDVELFLRSRADSDCSEALYCYVLLRLEPSFQVVKIPTLITRCGEDQPISLSLRHSKFYSHLYDTTINNVFAFHYLKHRDYCCLESQKEGIYQD